MTATRATASTALGASSGDPPSKPRSAPLDGVRLSAKLRVRGGDAIDAAVVIDVFHQWIRDDALDGEIAIDVADYRHVRSGPGVVLACHSGLFSFGEHGGRPGLRYAWRRDAAQGDGLSRAVGTLAGACKLLEDEGALARSLVFDTGILEIRFEDRLRLADETTALQRAASAVRPALKRLFASSGELTIDTVRAPSGSYGVDVRAEPPPSLEELARLALSRT